MNKRIAIIGIIVENPDNADQLNTLLHEFSQYIIGRMGIPFREKNLNIISVAVCADADTISALSGRLGRIPGINAKVTYSSVTVD